MNRRILFTALAAAALVAATALAGPLACGHHRGRHGMFHGEGEIDADRIRHAADWMLRSVDPSDEQVDRVAAIAESALRDLRALHGEAERPHEALIAALSAESVDRAALEQTRVAALARLDEMSRRATAAIAEAAEVLTPEQRATLIEEHAEHRGHGRWH